MLWLALHLPHLPLEVFTRATRDTRDAQPLAIASGAETGATVVAANRHAWRKNAASAPA